MPTKKSVQHGSNRKTRKHRIETNQDREKKKKETKDPWHQNLKLRRDIKLEKEGEKKERKTDHQNSSTVSKV